MSETSITPVRVHLSVTLSDHLGKSLMEKVGPPPEAIWNPRYRDPEIVAFFRAWGWATSAHARFGALVVFHGAWGEYVGLKETTHLFGAIAELATQDDRVIAEEGDPGRLLGWSFSEGAVRQRRVTRVADFEWADE